MDPSSILTQNVDTLFSNLENFTQKEGLIGKPVTHGDKTFIPVISVTLGYGSGNTANRNQQGNSSQNQAAGTANMEGGALGLGAKLSTESVIVIDKDTVSMLPMSTTANASQLIDKIPQMFMGMNQNKQQSGQQPGQQQGQQPGQQQNKS